MDSSESPEGQRQTVVSRDFASGSPVFGHNAAVYIGLHRGLATGILDQYTVSASTPVEPGSKDDGA